MVSVTMFFARGVIGWEWCICLVSAWLFLIQLWCPAGRLMSYETSRRTREANCAIGRLQFEHFAYIPLNFLLGGKTQNNLSLLGDCHEIRDIIVLWTETIVTIHCVIVQFWDDACSVTPKWKMMCGMIGIWEFTRFVRSVKYLPYHL